MILKKYFVGLSAMMMIFSNNPQVFADNIEIFGDEFENQTSPTTSEKPKETKPTETFNPPTETPPEVSEKPVDTPPKVVTEEPSAVVDEPFETPQTQQPVETQPSEIFNPPTETKSVSATNSNVDEEDFGDSLNFDDLNRSKNQNAPAENLSPNYPETNSGIRDNTTVVTPRENNSSSRTNSASPSTTAKKLKNLPQRFVQVAVDENYIYYLDKQSVSWKKIPYMNSEYMADVWIRMIERDPNTDDMPEDLANYVNDVNTDEIVLAKSKGYQYMAEDLKVLQNKKYFLEHYYLRPKKEQIQFLCELEVVGHPQNTTSQRKYDYQNWEELIPGSIESILYYSTIQVIGKSKSSERGHMTFADMLEEYARISIR